MVNQQCTVVLAAGVGRRFADVTGGVRMQFVPWKMAALQTAKMFF